jgi:hypothetical protein
VDRGPVGGRACTKPALGVSRQAPGNAPPGAAGKSDKEGEPVGRILAIIYVVIGIVIAANRDYFVDVNGFQGILSAILAVLLWPLIVLGVDINIGKGDNKKGGLVLVASLTQLYRLGGLLLDRSTRRLGQQISAMVGARRAP